MKGASENPEIQLPAPDQQGEMALAETLRRRESVRDFADRSLEPEAISRLLWALQGTTRPWGGRTAPSAGGLFPLEIYVVLTEGLFHYAPREHRLLRAAAGDLRGELAAAALGQACVREAPAVFVIAALVERTRRRYGDRAERYVYLEAGHAGQNLLLQATALGLGAVPVGAFQDDRVRQVLRLPSGQAPLYLIPVGHRR